MDVTFQKIAVNERKSINSLKTRLIKTHSYNIPLFLKNIPIFSNLDFHTLIKISNLGILKSVRKGSVVLFESDSTSSLFIIIKGRLKVSSIGNSQKEVILAVLQESDFFGEMSILDGSLRSANVIAIENSDLFVIQRNEFLNLLFEHSEITFALIKELVGRIRAADMKIKFLSLNDAEGKIASVILELAENNTDYQNKLVVDKIPFQRDLANMAGTSRETISRILNKMDRKGLIKHERSKIIVLNYGKLKELSK